MMCSLEVHIICCITLVEMIMCHLKVCAPYRPADEPTNEFALICNVDDSYASGKLDVGRFFAPLYSVKMQLSGKAIMAPMEFHSYGCV
jgi:hypothetical protein